MTKLIQIASSIRDGNAQLERVDEQLRLHGSTSSLSLSLAADSLQMSLDDMEAEFAAVAQTETIDLCAYRLIPAEDTERYPISALGRVLTEFQSAVSLFFDALASGSPKQRSNLSEQTRSATELQFHYSYAGSLGLMFSMPGRQADLADSVASLAVEAIFNLVHADSTEAIAAVTRRVGIAPVRCALRWAHAHIEAGSAADVSWRGAQSGRSHFVDLPELARFAEYAVAVSVEESDEFEVVGQLVGADGPSQYFHLIVEKQEYEGKLADNFPLGTELTLNRFYMAKLRRTTQRRLATEREDSRYRLLSLAPISRALHNQVADDDGSAGRD